MFVLAMEPQKTDTKKTVLLAPGKTSAFAKGKMVSVSFAGLFALLLLQCANAIHFSIVDSKQRCFIEEGGVAG